MKFANMLTAAAISTIALAGAAGAAGLCQGFGPQTPRDISLTAGSNTQTFPMAPASTAMNLCNIHTHTNAEHKGPGFSIFAGDEEHGGYKCNGSDSLTEAELEDPSHGHGHFHGIKPGDTIEVHWVFSSCQVTPGEGLGACLSDTCSNPTLRVETQVFLVVNDEHATSFDEFAYDGNVVNGLYQPKSLPGDTGTPVQFLGATTGTSYSQSVCSPFQVTWAVRPNCTKVSYQSLEEWVEKGNVFNENHSHGVRHLVTAPELLAPIN